MASDTDGGGEAEDTATVESLKSDVESLADTVASIKDAVETDKAPGESLGDIIEEFAERVSETDGVDKEAHAVEDILRESLAEESKENDDEMDDEDDEEEMESDATEKATEDAELGKGYDGEATREATLDDSAGTTAGMPSYADAAANHGGD